MARIITDLKESFRKGNTSNQLIFINIAVFVITTLVSVVWTLFNLGDSPIFSLLSFPASPMRALEQPWSLFTYMFMHAGFLHILFNMLWLYWFGAIFLYFFSGKHLRGLYLLGGICGAAVFMIAYNVFPYFHRAIDSSVLIGASASVLAIVTATAYREPNYQIQLFLFGSVRLKYLALIVILTDLLFITSDNAGGHIAHLGGALAGLWFAASLKRGIDLTAWINVPLDAITRLFGSLFTKKRKPKMKVHYGKHQQDYDYNAQKKEQTEDVDRILDKLKRSGYDSLTTEEKKRLFDASKK